ncbi:MAG: hypothetical protein ABL881_06085 [Novosphingobium sp.]
MASQPPRRVIPPLSGPQHFVPPSARELRGQAVQRVQSGLFGLAAVMLVVGLSNIINDRARMTEGFGPKPTAQSTASDSTANTDPLADIGVVPSAVPSEVPVNTTSPANAPR